MSSLFQLTDMFKADPNNPAAQAAGNKMSQMFGGNQELGNILGGVASFATNLFTNPQAIADMRNNNQQQSAPQSQPQTSTAAPVVPSFNKNYWQDLHSQQRPEHQDVFDLFSKQGMNGLQNLSQPMQSFLSNRVKPVGYNPFKINPWNEG